MGLASTVLMGTTLGLRFVRRTLPLNQAVQNVVAVIGTWQDDPEFGEADLSWTDEDGVEHTALNAQSTTERMLTMAQALEGQVSDGHNRASILSAVGGATFGAGVALLISGQKVQFIDFVKAAVGLVAFEATSRSTSAHAIAAGATLVQEGVNPGKADKDTRFLAGVIAAIAYPFVLSGLMGSPGDDSEILRPVGEDSLGVESDPESSIDTELEDLHRLERAEWEKSGYSSVIYVIVPNHTGNGGTENG